MGHKVSLPTEPAIHNNDGSERKHRKVTLSLLAIYLTASSVDSFTLPSSTPLDLRRSSRSYSSQTCFVSQSASLMDFPTVAAATATAESSLSAPGWLQRRLLLQPKRRREERKQSVEVDYERRKQEWAAKYTSVDALRETFGENKNKVWGDLDASTCRRLYKTLLPRSLLELYKLGVHPEDLAPLAYQARRAAKLYARERGVVPSRLFAMGYDGFRQWKRYGKFEPTGMSYDQIFEKYKGLIQEEEENLEDLTERDVTAKICLKILERSCTTNAQMDKIFLRDGFDYAATREEQQDISTLTDQLEKDVRSILAEAEGKEPSKTKNLTAQQVFTLRMVARAKHRMERFQKQKQPKENKKHREEMQKVPEEDNVRPWNSRMSKTGSRRRVWQDRTPPPRGSD